ncbi:MAG TPA: beta-propeller fold lactonase family protein [Candidatus Eisenbacteria bacterium]
MRTRLWFHRSLFLGSLLLAFGVVLEEFPGVRLFAAPFPAKRSGAASHSGPIAVTPDDRFVWVAQPDNDLVTLLEVERDANRVLKQIRVGDEPQNVAISPDGKWVYVSNTGSGTVSVIRANRGNPHMVKTIRVGTEPYGMALTPDGEKLYVANARFNDVSVIDTRGDRLVGTIGGVGLEPRGVAVAGGKVYVTQFLGVDRPGVLIGRDDYKEGRVTVISAATDDVVGSVTLQPLANTGFRSNGSALAHVPPTDPATFTFVTGAFPNMLNSIVVKGNRAYLPNAGASPDGPVRFNVNVQALLSVVDLTTDTESPTQTINMNRGINFEPPGPGRLFLAVPWTIDFKHRSAEGYAVIAGSNLLVKVFLDAEGTPSIRAPGAAGEPSGIVRIPVGQNPRGIAINQRDDRAYVMNEVSRDVSIVDLTTDQVIATVPAASLPRPGSDEATLLLGKALFNSSTGVNLPQLGPGGVIPNRLSSEGWSGCLSCHPFGLTDGVVWIFASGPRRTLPLSGSFNPRDPLDIKLLNHSAIFDELQDFELNIRNVSGGLGLITQADGTTPDPVVAAFNPPNAGRSAALDALTMFVAHGIRAPISPRSAGHRRIQQGRELFAAANCASCHGGPGWASSRRNFAPPPAASQIVNGQLVEFLKKVGTFDPAAPNEVRANGAPALGADGFNPPSLLGDFAMGPFFHSGSALTLDEVMENVVHRSAGTSGVDLLSDAGERRLLVQFLESIDASTRPFEIGGAPRDFHPRGATASVLAFAPELRLEVVGANPAHGRTRLAYTLPGAGPVELVVFDLFGRRVSTIVDGTKAAGRYEVAWAARLDDGAAARPGVYFARLKTIAGQRVVKLAVAR